MVVIYQYTEAEAAEWLLKMASSLGEDFSFEKKGSEETYFMMLYKGQNMGCIRGFHGLLEFSVFYYTHIDASELCGDMHLVPAHTPTSKHISMEEAEDYILKGIPVIDRTRELESAFAAEFKTLKDKYQKLAKEGM